MAGAIPGSILTMLFCITVWISVVLNPAAAPATAEIPMKERMRTLKFTLPILVLFILVIGGIYGGIFTPAEGGGIGAVGAFLVSLFMHRLTVKKFIAIPNDSAKFIAMCFAVLTGAFMLCHFMTPSRIPTVMASSIAAMELPAGLAMRAVEVFDLMDVGEAIMLCARERRETSGLHNPQGLPIHQSAVQQETFLHRAPQRQVRCRYARQVSIVVLASRKRPRPL